MSCVVSFLVLIPRLWVASKTYGPNALVTIARGTHHQRREKCRYSFFFLIYLFFLCKYHLISLFFHLSIFQLAYISLCHFICRIRDTDLGSVRFLLYCSYKIVYFTPLFKKLFFSINLSYFWICSLWRKYDYTLCIFFQYRSTAHLVSSANLTMSFSF